MTHSIRKPCRNMGLFIIFAVLTFIIGFDHVGPCRPYSYRGFLFSNFFDTFIL